MIGLWQWTPSWHCSACLIFRLWNFLISRQLCHPRLWRLRRCRCINVTHFRSSEHGWSYVYGDVNIFIETFWYLQFLAIKCSSLFCLIVNCQNCRRDSPYRDSFAFECMEQYPSPCYCIRTSSSFSITHYDKNFCVKRETNCYNIITLIFIKYKEIFKVIEIYHR